MKNKSSKIFFNVSEVSEMTGMKIAELKNMESVCPELKPFYFNSKQPFYQKKHIKRINRLKVKYFKIINKNEQTVNQQIIPLTSKKNLIDKKKKWSLKYDACIRCGTYKEKHRAKGLCTYCYDYDAGYKNRNHIVKKEHGYSAKILSRENLFHLYPEKEMSLQDIARTANCTRAYVCKKLKEHGIDSRDKSKTRQLALGKGKIEGKTNYIINKRFFKEWSKEMAYVLGFIYADGCLSPPWSGNSTIARFSISQKEPEILAKIKKLIGCDKKLYKRNNWPKGLLYTLDIANEIMYEDLLTLGLSPAKSNIIQYPNVPKEYSNHFIRGVFDGDGSVHENKNKLVVSFVSGSKTFLKSLQNIINEELQNDSCKFYITKRRKGQTNKRKLCNKNTCSEASL